MTFMIRSKNCATTCTRDYASEAAQEAEELMKDNLAASFVLALGIGVVIGYLIRRSTD